MSAKRQNIVYSKNPVYVFYAIGAASMFLLTCLFADNAVGPIEHAVFNVFFVLPDWLTPVFVTATAFGSFFLALAAGLLLLIRKRSDIALRLVAASGLACGLAIYLEQIFERARPDVLLGIVPKVNASGFAFPSSYAAVAAAIGATFALYARRANRRWVLPAVLLSGGSLLALGVNLPWDVIAGWAIGLFSYSTVSLVMGSKRHFVSAEKVASKMIAAGVKGAKLRPASVDARGSVPFFGEYEGGKIFVKVFNQDNNAADWLFKLARRLRYRRLEDEVPSLTPKRAMEHEAYLTMLAKNSANARVPEVLGIYNVEPNAYAMATQRIDAKSMDKLDKTRITDAMMDKAWDQIRKLHDHNIIHKDLRLANVMIEQKTGLPWLIDFGFSECAVDAKAFYKDNVEFIASSATLIGPKRAVSAALRAIGKQDLDSASAYMSYSALSGATTTALKVKKGLLQKIRAEMAAQSA